MFKYIFWSCLILVLLSPIIVFAQPCPCKSQVVGNAFGLAGGYSLAGVPAAISNNGDFFALWVVSHPSLPDRLTRGRLFDGFGIAKGPIVELEPNIFSPVSVTYNRDDNEFLLMLRRTTESGNQTIVEFLVQRVSANGNMIGTPKQIIRITGDSNLIVSGSIPVFDSIRHRFVFTYLIRNSTTDRIFVQKLTRKGLPVGSKILVKQDKNGSIAGLELKQDTIRNRFLLVWGTKTDVVYQILDSNLAKIGVNHNIPAEQDVGIAIHTSVFSERNDSFIIFWNSNDLEIMANSVSANGELGPSIKIGRRRALRIARPNPVTGGYLLLVASDGILRLNPDFTVARNIFEVGCAEDYTSAQGRSLLYNPQRQEFLVLWEFVTQNFTDVFLQGTRLRAAPTTNTCS